MKKRGKSTEKVITDKFNVKSQQRMHPPQAGTEGK
jgi:hypothetical protein